MQKTPLIENNEGVINIPKPKVAGGSNPAGRSSFHHQRDGLTIRLCRVLLLP